MKKPIVIFCGKGGVGKTTVSLALGLLHARNGKRVVVVTSHPLPELAVSVSLEGLRQSDPTAAANLFVVHIDPRQILDRMFQAQFPSQMLARSVLSSKIYRSLIEVSPGLKEMAFITRLKELTERRVDKETNTSFDLLIWDAPGTGHFLETMRVSQKFDTYLSGPFALRGKEVAQFFSERANLLLYPVTLVEEMAVEETIELCGKLAGELHIRPSGLICNLVSPMLSAPAEAFRDLESRFKRSSEKRADLPFVIDRHRIEREQYQKIRSVIDAPCFHVERVPVWESDLDLLSTVSSSLKEISVDVS